MRTTTRFLSIGRLIAWFGWFAMGVGWAQGACAATAAEPDQTRLLEVFVRAGCPHCADAKVFLPGFVAERPGLKLLFRDVVEDPAALSDLLRVSREAGRESPAVPTFVFRDRILVGFVDAPTTGPRLAALVSGKDPGRQSPTVSGETGKGFFGELRASRLGLPGFSVAMGVFDGLNPCAVWALLLLLSMLLHLHDRARMLLVAGTYILTAGAIHYALMSAWLNVYLIVGSSRLFESAIGVVALLLGLINVKDFFAPGVGVSLSLSADAKPALAARARRLLSAGSLWPALAGVATLAFFVNGAEILCTAGLPATYTAVIAREGLAPLTVHGYLALYVLGYMAPASILSVAVAAMLTSPRISVDAGRWLKLLSGLVMIGLGVTMLLPVGWP